jgi:ADP-dependent NAD(P)H-hydrate dehydratase / NAD(P)H-hydrate epimerase
MKVLTAEQMAYVDRTTIENGTPGIDLMRNAGMEVFGFIRDVLCIGSDIVIVAGKGNNGGDGFRIAELCAENGYGVHVLLLGKKSDVKGDAATCMNDFLKMSTNFVEISDSDKLAEHSDVIMSAQLIVDAVFGTGLNGEIKGLPASAIELVNMSGAAVAAVDIPSGVDATTGNVSKITVNADYTVSFGSPKVGHVVPPGRNMCGVIQIADIGFSDEVMDTVESAGNMLTSAEAAQLIPSRQYDAHKGSAGRVFLLAGSVGMTGAAALSASSVMRAGAGTVTVGCPESLNDILEIKLTEVMTLPLPEARRKRCLSLRALGLVRKAVSTADVVAVGPGLGTFVETSELVRRFISQYEGCVVLDADGINAFKGNPEALSAAPAEIVLTPHYGELSRLTGMSVGDIAADPAAAAKKAAALTGSTVLLKGAPTIVADPEGEIWINVTGNEGMATAGMGDVLTGIISGFAAQGRSLFEAAVLGAYVHGMAGDYAADDQGMHSMTAGDVLERLPRAISDIVAQSNV